MELNQYLDRLRASLEATAAAGSPEVLEAAGRLSQAMEPALRLTLMELASDLAAGVTAQLDGDVVDVRLRGGAPEIVVTPRPQDAPVDVARTVVIDDDGAQARLSLRLPEALKTRVDAAAGAAGVSANTWITRAVSAALTPTTPFESSARPGSRRVVGWAR